MLNHLEKFQKLDPKLRDLVSSPEAMQSVHSLEEKYRVNLSELIILVMVREIALVALPGSLTSTLGLETSVAAALYNELRNGIFLPVLDYLEGKPAETSVAPVEHEINTTVKPTEDYGAVYIVHPEDEAEVKAQVAQPMTVTDQGVAARHAEEVISSLGLSFGSELLLTRLKAIIDSYIRGIRNKVDTRLALTKPFENGGMKLDSQEADNILGFIDQQNQGGWQGGGAVLEQRQDNFNESLKKLGARDVAYDFSEVIAKNAESAPLSAGQVDQFAWRQPREVVGKVMMTDIKVNAPKVMGLVDELRFMDLVIFRRFSKNPEEATAKIKEKIQLLELESYTKRLQGIKAWRQSPLNSIYLKIADTALKDGVSVEEVIENFQKDKNNLSIQEFISIMKLNKSLRY